jgi:ABC-type nitrate/sulfonate/bicarbonate transport system substrate-binding protein
LEKLWLGLEWFLNPDHLPLLVAREEGWFGEVGLEVELIEPEEHFDAIDEIKSGRMDVAITEPIHLVGDRAQGDPVTGFARFLHTNGGVMYFRGSGIERPRDMAGKRVQYPGAPGPGGPAIVKTMIEADGGECDPSELTPVNNGFYHTDALIEGKADVATLIFYNFEVLEARGRGQDPAFFALKDWGVPDFCQLILISTEETLNRRRDAFGRLLKVLRWGIDFAHEKPSRAQSIYKRLTDTSPQDSLSKAILDATLPCFTYDFSMSHDYYRRLGAWMRETGQIENEPDPASYWTNELAL